MHIDLFDFIYQITWHKAWKAHLGRESDQTLWAQKKEWLILTVNEDKGFMEEIAFWWDLMSKILIAWQKNTA